jgi:hypothetical protein
MLMSMLSGWRGSARPHRRREWPRFPDFMNDNLKLWLDSTAGGPDAWVGCAERSTTSAILDGVIHQLLLLCLRTRLLQRLPQRTDSFIPAQLVFSLPPKARLITISFRHI